MLLAEIQKKKLIALVCIKEKKYKPFEKMILNTTLNPDIATTSSKLEAAITREGIPVCYMLLSFNDKFKLC